MHRGDAIMNKIKMKGKRMRLMTKAEKQCLSDVISNAATEAAEKAIQEIEQKGPSHNFARMQFCSDLKKCEMTAKVAHFVREMLLGMRKKLEGGLVLISDPKKLFLDSCDGGETLLGTQVLSGVDSHLDLQKLNAENPPTKPVYVQVYEASRFFENLFEVYAELGDDLDRLCFTQAQIAQFVRNHIQLFEVNKSSRRRENIVFLSKAKHGYYAVMVRRNEGSKPFYANYRSLLIGASEGERFVFPLEDIVP